MSGTGERCSDGVEGLPAEMVARAAAILGVGGDGIDEERNSHERGPHLVTVRVAGPRGERVLRVPLGVPVGELGEAIGDAVGAGGAASVSLRGQVVLPHQTLAEAGAGAGSTLTVGDLPWSQASEPVPVCVGRGVRGGRRPVGHASLALFGTLSSVLAVGAFFAGGAALGGAKGAPVALAAKLARAAAQAWVSGKPFSGRAGGDVGADLGHRGPPLGGALEPAGWWSTPGLLSEQFVVGGPDGAYGLSVVVYKGYVVFPPTPSPLPFVEPPGAHVAETGITVRTGLGRYAEDWAKATFGPTGALRPAGLGLAGNVQILDEWQPRSGAALVARVQVPLSTADGFAAYTAHSQLESSQDAVLACRQGVVGAAARLKLAEEGARAANAGAERALQAVNAGVPLSPSALATQGAATNADEAVTKAKVVFRAAEGDLGTAERREATAELELQKAQSKPISVSGVYDVAFDRQDKAVAWAPGEYGA